ncbi:MAG: hypothetical protein NVSMB19_22120 [Vulcanimicrobiaceae bacterium]
MTSVRGTVINIHHHGATVRLEDGSLATVPALELLANRPAYVASLAKRLPLELTVDRHGRHRTAALAATSATASPAAVDVRASTFFDDVFEARMGAYLKETEAWAPPDQAPPAERHFIRKKRRARLFEARTDTT